MIFKHKEGDLLVMGSWYSASDLILQAELILEAAEQDALLTDIRNKVKRLRKILLEGLPDMRILAAATWHANDSVNNIFEDARSWCKEVNEWINKECERSWLLSDETKGLKEADSFLSPDDLLTRIRNIIKALENDPGLSERADEQSLLKKGNDLKNRMIKPEIAAEIGRLKNLPLPIKRHLFRKGALLHGLECLSLAGTQLHSKAPDKAARYKLVILEEPMGFAGTEGINKSLGQTVRDQRLSLLTDWLDGTIANPHKTDPDKKSLKRVNRWRDIAWEVYERKILLLASARDLQENRVPDPLKLAATDIFVEKAQLLLSDRGRNYYWCGAGVAALALGFLAWVAYFLFTKTPLELLGVDKSLIRSPGMSIDQWKLIWETKITPAYMSVALLKGTTAAAFVGAIAYFLISLSRALLHEATVCFNRRHSLRFGRLFVYLLSGQLTRQDLEEAFNWNANFSTAFKDIEAEKIAKSPLTKMLETPAETIKASTEVIKILSSKLEKEAKGKKDAPTEDPEE